MAFEALARLNVLAHYVLEAAAITFVFTKGTIFKSLREHGPKLWQELASCPLCAGVWIGMLWRVLRTWSESHGLTVAFAADVLASGAATGVVALVVVLFVALLDRWS